MALTAEEIAAANERARDNLEHQRIAQDKSMSHAALLQEKQAWVTFVQIAQATLTENKRTLPVDQRAVSPEEIVEFANALKAASTPPTT